MIYVIIDIITVKYHNISLFPIKWLKVHSYDAIAHLQIMKINSFTWS